MSDPYQDHPNVSPGTDSVWGSAGGQTLWIPQTTLNGGSLSALGKSNGTDDTATIQAALNSYTYVKGLPLETYLISSQLVLKSGGRLDMTGCTVRLLSGHQSKMVTNYASENPVATGTGSVSSGSNVVTTSLASQAQAGQTLTVAGAGGSGNGPLIGNISAVNTGAGTITLLKLDGVTAANASATVSGAAVTLSSRDTDIQVIGGTWDRGANGPNSGTGAGQGVIGHSLFFKHVDGLRVDIERAVSTAGITFVWPTDVKDFWIAVRSANVVRTVVQVVGPAYNGHVDYVRGTSNDDMVNFCGNVYTDQTDTCGDVINVSFGELIAEGVGGAALKLNAGAGCTIDGINGKAIFGTPAYGLFMGDDTSQAATTGGNYGAVDFGYINVTPTAKSAFFTSPTARLIRGKVTVNTSTAILVGGSSANTISLLDLDVDYNGALVDAVLFAGPTIVNKAIIRGSFIGSGSGGAVRAHSAAVINSLVFDRVSAQFTGGNCQIFRVDENGLAVIDEVMFRDCSATFSTVVGTNYMAYLNGSNTCKKVKFSGGYCSTGSALYRVESVVTASVVEVDGVTTVNNDRLLNLRSNIAVLVGRVHCTNNASAAVFVSGATVDWYGGQVILSSGSTTLLQRAATETINMRAPGQRVDLSQVAAIAEGAAYNTNSSTLPGVGPALCDGTTWRRADLGTVKTGTATLVAGTVTVADTAITANSIIRLSRKTMGGTPGALYVSALTASTSFAITSTNAADTSVVYYEIVNY